MVQYLLPITILLIILVFLYQTFLSDMIANKIKLSKEREIKHSNIEKIARVKLVSDNPKDIENFITENAQYLSDEMVGLLVGRIDSIKNDQVINADNLLKKRIDSLDSQDEPAVLKQASRKK